MVVLIDELDDLNQEVFNLRESKGLDYLFLALYAFAGLATELIYAFLLEPALYNAPMESWTTAQTIIHWIITCATWGIITFLLIKTANKKYNFNLFENDGDLKIWQWVSVLFCLVFMIVLSYIDWDGFKVVKEFEKKGLLKFIFQYIYYAFETGLFALIIIFGQKTFEKWFKKRNFPYGGILVALTWGLGHILSKGSILAGITTALSGFIFGVVYLLINRDVKKTFVLLFIMFAF